MRFEVLIWFIVGGLFFLYSINVPIITIYDNPGWGITSYLFGFVAFFFMGLGLIMLIKEITKSVAFSE